ncbi:MAG: DUF1501 domain-containing protein [Luteolibacter sp.]
MKQHQKEELRSRRDFLRQSTCASLGVTGLVNVLANLRLITAASAQVLPQDYKALVCLFLSGGNDSNNMIVPLGDTLSSELRSDYESARGALALPVLNPIDGTPSLHPLTPASDNAFQRHYAGTNQPLGLHPSCGEMATLFAEGDLAILANVGTLAYPLQNRDEYINKTVPLPMQLFSHSDQSTQWQSSVADKRFASGWGGRAADLLNASYNADSKASMSISLAGLNTFQVGTAGVVNQYSVGTGGAVSLSGYGTNYSYAYNNPSETSEGYTSNANGLRLAAFEKIMNLTHENLLEDHYNSIIRNARATEGVVGAALTAAASSGVDFDAHFMNAQTSLGDQLKAVAKLIAGRQAIGNNRQIFFCEIRGFDTHASALGSHENLMAELSGALGAFRNTLKDPGLDVFDDVTTFTMSDFNRTLLANGSDDESGSDHAWGGHHVVMGGAINGGDIYGHFPPLKTGAGLDTHTTRGRFIPETSVDQYAAILTKWMGVGSNEIEAIFPNLPRFDNPFTTESANLGFL